MRVFIARHGERQDFVDASWREESAFPDDPPLTTWGESQARRMGEYIHSIGGRITGVYASPFSRCVRTASLAIASYEQACARSRSGCQVPLEGAIETGAQIETNDDSLTENRDEIQSLSVAIEPGLCERLSFARYWSSPGDHGPVWRSVSQLAQSAAVVDGRSRAHLDYSPVCSFQLCQTGFPEDLQKFRNRCKDVVERILEKHRPHSQQDILIVAHVSSTKAIIDTLTPGTTSWLTSVSCTSDSERLSSLFFIIFYFVCAVCTIRSVALSRVLILTNLCFLFYFSNCPMVFSVPKQIAA